MIGSWNLRPRPSGRSRPAAAIGRLCDESVLRSGRSLQIGGLGRGTRFSLPRGATFSASAADAPPRHGWPTAVGRILRLADGRIALPLRDAGSAAATFPRGAGGVPTAAVGCRGRIRTFCVHDATRVPVGRDTRLPRVSSGSVSLIYRNAAGYELVMRALYGRHHAGRLRAVAEQVPAGASVLELRCGPGIALPRASAGSRQRLHRARRQPRLRRGTPVARGRCPAGRPDRSRRSAARAPRRRSSRPVSITFSRTRIGF